jgi:hypothetical protein
VKRSTNNLAAAFAKRAVDENCFGHILPRLEIPFLTAVDVCAGAYAKQQPEHPIEYSFTSEAFCRYAASR